LRIAGAPDSDSPLAVLRRFDRVVRRQSAVRFRDRPEVFLDKAERFRFVEFSGYQQDGVVRLIVTFVERLESFNGNVLDVGTRSDG